MKILRIYLKKKVLKGLSELAAVVCLPASSVRGGSF